MAGPLAAREFRNIFDGDVFMLLVMRMRFA
jgi:hypothetical protein